MREHDRTNSDGCLESDKTIKDKILPLMSFEVELRDKILEYLVHGSPIRVFLAPRGRDPPTAIQLPITARVGNRKLRQETIRVALMNTTLEIHSGPGNRKLQQWLSSIDLSLASKGQTNGFDAVKKLSFPYFSFLPYDRLLADTPHGDIELMKKCSNLREVSIYFSPGQVCDYFAPDKSAQQLRQDYRLDGMLGLEKLETLRFLGWYGSNPNSGICELARWFEDSFKSQKEVGKRRR